MSFILHLHFHSTSVLCFINHCLHILSWKSSDQSFMMSYHPCPFHPLHLSLIKSYDIIIRTPSYAIPSYMSCHILNYAMPYHHIFHFIIHAMSSLPLSFLWIILSSPFVFPLSFTDFTLPSCPLLILCHSWTTLTSMTTIIHIANNYNLNRWLSSLYLLISTID